MIDHEIREADERNRGGRIMSRFSFQFSLRSMLVLTTAFAVMFGVFRWAQLSIWASLLVTLLFVISFTGGIALIVSMLQSIGNDGDDS